MGVIVGGGVASDTLLAFAGKFKPFAQIQPVTSFGVLT